ncbi:site-specific DNA-methyltransferase [Clostridium sp. 'deep sea']|uniref:DNA-methyltransferase n=1 Tax=Clostridium sp. 'deep sea' TaxID=2779445 RepID=UPI001896701B|nr:site-specific DNA-methyltransferase [Clostridium sp. 'deep sea']QOR36052.1 site-specific DNA-methyltransferase [Clostridium sp. 'deep sea']
MTKQNSRNKTITLEEKEIKKLKKNLLYLKRKRDLTKITNKIINQDLLQASKYLPKKSVDLMVLDPPYNLTKKFNSSVFHSRSYSEYQQVFENWLKTLMPLLKDTASVYICSEWNTSIPIFEIANKYLKIQNRIVWQREKGRGAKRNWKNNSEDIWFCTVSDDYYFDVDAVKVRKKVIAPYRNNEGKPKDWKQEGSDRYRMTFPSNIWTDLTVPFWSMKENTPHPTQKPEKMLAKIILASSKEGDIVLDPFLGSGTTAVVAKKLNRNYIGIELDEYFSCLALERLNRADKDKRIQGYTDGQFWERNTFAYQK